MNKRVLAPAMAIAIAAGSVVAVGNADAQEFTAAELYEPEIHSVYDLGPDEQDAILVFVPGQRMVSVDLNLFESPYSGLKMERDTSPYAYPAAIKLRLEGGKIYPERFDVLVGVTVHYDDGSSEYVEGPFTVYPLKALVAGEPAEPKKPTTTPRATVSVTVTETTTSTEYFPEPYPDPYPVWETETETATVTKTETATFTEYVHEPYPVYETETATVTKTETSRVTTTETEYFPEPYPDPYPVYETETVTETETVIVTPTENVKAPAKPVTVTTTAVAAPVTVTEAAAPITKVATVTATPKVVSATATTTVKVTEAKEAKVTETVTKTASAAADNGSSLGTGGVIAIVLGLLAALGAGAFALSGGLPPQLANTLPF